MQECSNEKYYEKYYDNYDENKTKVISADLLDFNFDLNAFLDFVTFQL